MIAGLKPYPVMKDFGVPWLGEVPAHWKVEPIGRIGQLFKSVSKKFWLDSGLMV